MIGSSRFGRFTEAGRRVLVVLLVTSSALGVGSVAISSGRAGAGTAAAEVGGSSVTCSKLSGSAQAKVTISKCVPSAGTGYKSASQPGGTFATGVLTWSSSRTTTTLGSSTLDFLDTRGPCTGTSEEVHWTTAVAAASTVGRGIPAVGDTISAYVCMHFEYHNGAEHLTKILLAPGTTVSL
jgi:hypothetical protein